MIFTETELPGVLVVEPERLGDERGFFARTWCQREAEARGLTTGLAQCSISFSRRKGTLRGLHYQARPCEETKWVRCTRGAVHDVVLDVQPTSPTFKRWMAVQLTADNRRILYVPPGFAQGYLTLEDNTEVFYQMSEFYVPECVRRVRWNDPAFGIPWPGPVLVISQQDRDCPDFPELSQPLRPGCPR